MKTWILIICLWASALPAASIDDAKFTYRDTKFPSVLTLALTPYLFPFFPPVWEAGNTRLSYRQVELHLEANDADEALRYHRRGWKMRYGGAAMFVGGLVGMIAFSNQPESFRDENYGLGLSTALLTYGGLGVSGFSGPLGFRKAETEFSSLVESRNTKMAVSSVSRESQKGENGRPIFDESSPSNTPKQNSEALDVSVIAVAADSKAEIERKKERAKKFKSPGTAIALSAFLGFFGAGYLYVDEPWWALGFMGAHFGLGAWAQAESDLGPTLIAGAILAGTSTIQAVHSAYLAPSVPRNNSNSAFPQTRKDLKVQLGLLPSCLCQGISLSHAF